MNFYNLLEEYSKQLQPDHKVVLVLLHQHQQ